MREFSYKKKICMLCEAAKSEDSLYNFSDALKYMEDKADDAAWEIDKWDRYFKDDKFTYFDLFWIYLQEYAKKYPERIRKENLAKAVNLDGKAFDLENDYAEFHVPSYNLLLWSQNKIAYRFTKELRDALIAQDNDNDIPVEALKQLPFRSFFIDTGDFDPESDNDKKYLSDTMAFQKNKIQEPKRTYIGCFVSYRENPFKDGPDSLIITWVVHAKAFLAINNELVFQPIKLPFYKGETIEQVFSRYQEEWSQPLTCTGTANVSAEKETILAMHYVKPIMQLIMYLSAENAEIRETEYSKAAYRPPTPGFIKHKERECKEFEVGTEFTVRYREFIQKKKSSPARADGDSYMVSPHKRRSHWHHYWVGSEKDNSKRLVLKWIDEFWIHEELKELAIPTVARVR